MKPHPADTGLRASHKNLIKTLAREIHSKAETETIIHIRKLHGSSFWQKLVLKCLKGENSISKAQNEKNFFISRQKSRQFKVLEAKFVANVEFIVIVKGLL